MKTKFDRRAVQIAWLLTLVYFASYLMRKSFETMVDAVLLETGWTKSALSMVVVGMAICYGAGQLISGFLGDRFSPTKLISIGLGLAFGCNMAMVLCRTAPAMCAVWCVNGFAHALLWPPMVALLSHTVKADEYAYASVRISWGSSFATIFLYLFCSTMLRVASWRVILACCAAGGLALTVIWLLASRRLFGDVVTSQKGVASNGTRTPLQKFVWIPVVLFMLAIVLQGMLRDGVSGWMPTILRESFRLSSEDSILLTVAQAILSIISFSVFGKLQQRLVHNEALCASLIFGLSAVCGGGLLLLGGAEGPLVVALSVALMSMLCGCMHGVNLMLIAFVPRHFAKTGRVSFFSGLLNACTYVGTAAGYFLFALLSADGSWDSTTVSWLVVAACGTLLCAAAGPLWQRFTKEFT